MIYNYIPIQIGGYYKVTGPEISYQFDELQFLVLTGVQLPAAFQVDFCNEGDTSTITMVGTNSTVQIPDEYLLTGKRIKAYIVLTGSDEGAVETRIEITLPVNRRPSRTDIEPTPAEQSTIDSLVAAMNEAIEDAETGSQDIRATRSPERTIPATPIWWTGSRSIRTARPTSSARAARSETAARSMWRVSDY